MHNGLKNQVKSFEEVEVWLTGPVVVFTVIYPILAHYLENNWDMRKFYNLVPRMDTEMS